MQMMRVFEDKNSKQTLPNYIYYFIFANDKLFF